MLADMVSQVTATQQIHDHIEAFPVLEGIVHIDKEHVVELGKDLTLVHDALDRALSDHPSLAHLLHCEFLLRLLPVHLPNLAKATLADAMHETEAVLRDR